MNKTKTVKDFTQAIKHFPRLYYDNNEPFLPIKIGYKIYRMKQIADHYQSPTFSRTLIFLQELLNTDQDAQAIIEYSLWYEADISHLYELEHLWVYLNDKNKVIKIEGSRHGNIINLNLHQKIIIEPGKHGHAQGKLSDRFKKLLIYICQKPGTTGLLIDGINAPSLFQFKNLLAVKYKTPQLDKKIMEYLNYYKFIPSFKFQKEFIVEKENFMPWKKFEEYIKKFLLTKIKNLSRSNAFLKNTSS